MSTRTCHQANYNRVAMVFGERELLLYNTHHTLSQTSFHSYIHTHTQSHSFLKPVSIFTHAPCKPFLKPTYNDSFSNQFQYSHMHHANRFSNQHTMIPSQTSSILISTPNLFLYSPTYNDSLSMQFLCCLKYTYNKPHPCAKSCEVLPPANNKNY